MMQSILSPTHAIPHTAHLALSQRLHDELGLVVADGCLAHAQVSG